MILVVHWPRPRRAPASASDHATRKNPQEKSDKTTMLTVGGPSPFAAVAGAGAPSVLSKPTTNSLLAPNSGAPTPDPAAKPATGGLFGTLATRPTSTPLPSFSFPPSTPRGPTPPGSPFESRSVLAQAPSAEKGPSRFGTNATFGSAAQPIEKSSVLGPFPTGSTNFS